MTERKHEPFGDTFDYVWSNKVAGVVSFVAYDKRTGHKYTQFRMYQPNPATAKHNDPGIPRRVITARGDNIQASLSWFYNIGRSHGDWSKRVPLVRYDRI